MISTLAAYTVGACIVSLAVALPAAAAAEPVEGAGSFNDAPVLGPGTYRDTIRNNEFTFYAVDLAEGQQLKVRGRLTSAPGQQSFAGGIVLAFYNPWRVRDVELGPRTGTPIAASGAVSRVRGKGLPVGGGDGDPARAALYREPGRYYVGFINTVRKQRIEHPLKFTVKITGAPAEVEIAPEATPSIVGTPGIVEPEATDTPPPAPAEDDPEPEGDDGGVVRLGLAALLGGFAAGAGAGFFRRRA